MSVNKYINGKLLQMSGNADTRLTKDDINTILGYTPADSSVCEETFKKYVQLDGGDTTDNITTFTSNDTSESSSWTDVDVMNSGEKHSGLFSKISTMFKNIRYLYKLLGTTDISTIGDGTVRGAIDTLNSNLSCLRFKIIKTFKLGSNNGTYTISDLYGQYIIISNQGGAIGNIAGMSFAVITSYASGCKAFTICGGDMYKHITISVEPGAITLTNPNGCDTFMSLYQI